MLSERAVLVRPSISVWRGEITDRAASRETADRFQANAASLRTVKHLVPKEAIDPIASAANAMRGFVRVETLPWRWDGVGLLPTENYLPFMGGWRAHLVCFDAAVRGLLERWPIWCAKGQQALGGLARDIEYPSHDEVAGKFDARLEVLPVPDAADFRASVTEAEAETIREQLTADNEAALATAERALWDQMQECVGHIVERLGAYGRDKDGKVVGRFADTLVGNLRQLVERLPRLNLTSDPELEAMRARLASSLCPYEPDELRQNDGLRASVHDEAARIMADMSAIYGGRAAP